MNDDFTKTLEQVLAQKKVWISNEIISRLNFVISEYENSFNQFYAMLLKEKIVREDPYKGDRASKKIEVPSSEMFGEEVKSSELAFRLSMYSVQLTNLKSTNLTVDMCNISFLKKVLDLLNYFKWEGGLYNENHFMTASLSSVIKQLPSGSPLFISIYEKAKELDKFVKDALLCIEHLVSYTKESYKVFVVSSYFSDIKFVGDSPSFDKGVENFLQELQHKMLATKIVPFYKDLCQEAILDHYAMDLKSRQNIILQSIGNQTLEPLSFEKKALEDKNSKKDEKEELKLILLEAIGECGRVVISLDIMIRKLNFNHQSYNTYSLSFIKKFMRSLKNMVFQEKVTYKVVYTTPSSGLSVTEKVDYFHFLSKTNDFVKRLINYTDSFLLDPHKIKGVDEESMSDRLTRIALDIKIIATKIDSLDKFFKHGMSAKHTFRFKGMTNELKNVQRGVRVMQEFISAYNNDKARIELETQLSEYMENETDLFSN